MKKKNEDEARRTRLYGALCDGETLRKGLDYSELPERYIFYISEKDIWKKGRSVYRERKFLDGDVPHRDGAYVIYVNAAVKDGSRIADLMDYFSRADPDDDSEGDLSRRIHFLKRKEGGWKIMCEVSERIRQMGIEEGIKEGIKEGKKLGERRGRQRGREQANRSTARNLAELGMPLEQIAKAVSTDVVTVGKWLQKPGQTGGRH